MAERVVFQVSREEKPMLLCPTHRVLRKSGAEDVVLRCLEE